MFFLAVVFSEEVQYGPLTIEGTIEKVSWIPAEFKIGIPGMSGSLGDNRIMPAHYKVNLIGTITSNNDSGYNPYDNAKVAEIILFNKKRKLDFLRAGMRIKIIDYILHGDEGGWDSSSFEKIEIIIEENESKN